MNDLGEEHLEGGSLLLVETGRVDHLAELELLAERLDLLEVGEPGGVDQNTTLLLKLSFHFCVFL